VLWIQLFFVYGLHFSCIDFIILGLCTLRNTCGDTSAGITALTTASKRTLEMTRSTLPARSWTSQRRNGSMYVSLLWFCSVLYSSYVHQTSFSSSLNSFRFSLCSVPYGRKCCSH
jgi:hypothetical protein